MNLRTILILCLTLLVGQLSFSSCTTHRETVNAKQTDSHFTLIIMYDAAIGKQPLLKAMKKYKAKKLYDYKNFNGIAISISQSYDESQTIHFFKNVKGVLSVQKDRKMQLLNSRQ